MGGQPCTIMGGFERLGGLGTEAQFEWEAE